MTCWKCRALLFVIVYPARPLPAIHLVCPKGCGTIPYKPLTSN